MDFYLGTHQPGWLGTTDVSLFVSRRRLCELKTLPRARQSWALDSGGFSELSMFGRWTVTPQQYVAEVQCWTRDVGNLAWAATQDWMCEPWILAKTGLSVAEHQRRSVQSYLDLTALAPEVAWLPVLQGQTLRDYVQHALDYLRAGVSLKALPRVGLGSVCRRQATPEIEEIVRTLHRAGLKLHGFGVKTLGLRRLAPYLASADSMAWSFAARRAQRPMFAECTTHKNCANCRRYALAWRDRLVGELSHA